ncbi:peptidoglycan DD-metalloendopeptidase family protein [Thermocrinis sp.]
MHIEIRERRPQTTKQVPKPQETPKPREQPKKPVPKEELPRVLTPVNGEQPKKPVPKEELPRVLTPVNGVPVKSGRGYFIKTSCDEFFRSVEEGRVLYAGDDLKGYSWVIMVDQTNGYISVYTKAGNVLVKKGERVRKGQVLGKVGGHDRECGIGFELRLQDGSPVSFELVR